jgi:hypothetical protein
MGYGRGVKKLILLIIISFSFSFSLSLFSVTNSLFAFTLYMGVILAVIFWIIGKEEEEALEKGERLKQINIANKKKLAREKLAAKEQSEKQKQIDRKISKALSQTVTKTRSTEKKKLAKDKLAKEKLADKGLAGKIAKLRRTEKLQLAQHVIRQVNLKEFHLAVSFYGEDERDSLLREENESLNDHYKKEIINALGFSDRTESKVWVEFFKEIKELGMSLLTKSLESESFKTMLEEKGATADNAGQSQKIEKNKSWDELKKEL